VIVRFLGISFFFTGAAVSESGLMSLLLVPSFEASSFGFISSIAVFSLLFSSAFLFVLFDYLLC